MGVSSSMRVRTTVWASVTLVTMASCGRSPADEEAPVPFRRVCESVQRESPLPRIGTWAVGSCLGVTFEPGAEDNARQLFAALSKWARAPGTWLCFDPPRPAMQPEPRAIHVRPPTNASQYFALTDVQHVHGEISRAEVRYDERLGSTWSVYYAQSAGQLLGFQRAPEVESVVNARFPYDSPELTEADIASVVAAYPTCR